MSTTTPVSTLSKTGAVLDLLGRCPLDRQGGWHLDKRGLDVDLRLIDSKGIAALLSG